MPKLRLFSRIDADTTQKTLRIYREEARRDKRAVILFSTTIPVGYFLYLVLLPLLISFLTQSLITHPHDIATPLWLLAGMAAASLASIIAQHYGFIALFRHEESMATQLTKRAMDALLRHSHGFFANQKVGSLAGDINTFSRSYMNILDTLFLGLASILVNFVTSLIVVAFVAPIMLPPLMIITAFVIFENLLSIQKRAPSRNKRKELSSRLFGLIADIIGNNTLVRLFGQRHAEVNRTLLARKEIQAVANEELVEIQRSANVQKGVTFTFQILTMGFCIYLFTNSLLSIGALIFIITYLGRIASSMFGISSIIRNIEQSFLDASKITEILDLPYEITDLPHAKPLDISHGAIDIHDVTFAYGDDTERHVFSNLTLAIPAGQRVGVVGKSGSGKTTLTHLLLRYADVTSGTITIDGQDITNVPQDDVRNAIAYVPQDPFLFHRSLRDNIAYGKPAATDEEVITAAKQANAWEFIEAMPKGLDTIVGERGIKLSGGQRQRIAIARAILKDAPILILDEATSALDSESEALIQQSLNSLLDDHTSLVVAHRLSTLRHMDRIVVMSHGKIVEDGTHAELLAENGVYARLWKRQSGGFIEE